jgi:hypothetical protein
MDEYRAEHARQGSEVRSGANAGPSLGAGAGSELHRLKGKANSSGRDTSLNTAAWEDRQPPGSLRKLDHMADTEKKGSAREQRSEREETSDRRPRRVVELISDAIGNAGETRRLIAIILAVAISALIGLGLVLLTIVLTTRGLGSLGVGVVLPASASSLTYLTVRLVGKIRGVNGRATSEEHQPNRR